MSYSSAYDAHLDNYGDPAPYGADDEYAVPEGLVESERTSRDEAARIGRQPRNPIYKTGPIIAPYSISVNGYYGYHDSGLRTAVYIARKNSKRDSLLHVVARKVADDRDTPVCGFEGGVEVPLDDVRRVIVNGYGG